MLAAHAPGGQNIAGALRGSLAEEAARASRTLSSKRFDQSARGDRMAPGLPASPRKTERPAQTDGAVRSNADCRPDQFRAALPVRTDLCRSRKEPQLLQARSGIRPEESIRLLRAGVRPDVGG